MKRRVVAVVVTYNRIELLKLCLNAIKKQTVNLNNIVVVDNYSCDGTKEYLEELSKEEAFVCVYSDRNIGGAGGFFTGIMKAISLGGQDIWLMDDDTIPQENALKSLLEVRDRVDSHYGFLSSYVEWIDGSECVMNRPLRKKELIKTSDSQYPRLLQATFVSMLVSQEAIRDVGLPIADYFIWGDDQEYSRRISKRYPCYFVVNSRVCHKMEKNAGSNILIDSADRIDRYYYKYRNEFHMAKHKNPLSVVFYFFRCLRDICKVALLSDGDKKKRVKVILSGMVSGLVFKPQIKGIDEA